MILKRRGQNESNKKWNRTPGHEKPIVLKEIYRLMTDTSAFYTHIHTHMHTL